ncbi:MAG TPA: DUF1778 domain-containing protein [Planctomycetaceae bacterium]|nr:DUF1778 domain-containing protein [Planctomycetaceae bacterium]HQZ68255.1 DUF1778 domain-containing protein [Planctomycetaceae bacterium]
MNGKSAKTARLDARLPQSVLDLIKTAADLQGRSLSEFVIGSAREAAERTLQEQASLELSLDDQVRFAKAMPGPQKVAPAMRRAAKKHAAIVESDVGPRLK